MVPAHKMIIKDSSSLALPTAAHKEQRYGQKRLGRKKKVVQKHLGLEKKIIFFGFIFE